MSSLSDYEFIKIVATLESQYTKEINCYTCCSRFSHYTNKAKAEEKLKAYQKAKGCLGSENVLYAIGVDSTQKTVKFSSCAGNYTSLSVNYYVDLFYQYDKGVLPFKGKLGDQPSKMIEIFQLISDKITKKNQERLEKESRKK